MFAKALQQDGLSLVYQPIFKIKDESICGFETLLRWNDDRLGSIGPDVFIPLSETDGLQEEVTLYVLKHAIHDFIHVAIQYNIFLSININVSDLHSERFSSTLINLIQDYQIPNGLILLEISERHGGNLEDMKLFIEKYKLIGVRFAIDDFGTGHSNLNLISALEIDEIKIDKCFTDTIGTTSFRKNILPGLQTMFKHISEKIIFEGVETQIQVEYLKEFWPGSCIQGWYYSKALGFPEAVKLISQNRESHPKRLINRT
jgi:sensor c-di-GMP phosphodiesterase-like protein